MFDKNLINEYKNKKMPGDIKNNIYENMQSFKPSVKYNFSFKRRILIYAAVFMSLVLIVSAAAIVYNNTQYVPFKGFVEGGDYEIYATPEIIEFGDAIIETVMRIQEGEKSELVIILTSEYYLTPEHIYKNLKVTTPDGKIYTIEDNGIMSSAVLRMKIPDFPAVNDFAISVSNISANISLVKNGLDNETGDEGSFGFIEKNGLSFKMKQLTKGSKILAYEIKEEIIDLDYLFGEKNPFIKDLRLIGINVYDEAGNNCTSTGYSGSGYGADDNILILRDRPEGKITKVSFDTDLPIVRVWTYDDGIEYVKDDNGVYYLLYNDENKIIYSDVEIPIPADGDEIIFEDGLVIYDHNGLTCTLESVLRENNEINIITYTEYIGEGNEYIWEYGIDIGWISDWPYSGVSGSGRNNFKIEGTEESIKLIMSSINYRIAGTGNWEIDFN